MNEDGNDGDGQRLDKWLWCARFFKSRSLATQAVDAGHVRLNGSRSKPGRDIRVGDRVWLRAGEREWEVVILALADRRGPAPEAARLYRETPESMLAETARQDSRVTGQSPAATVRGRPTKRAGRLIRRFTDPG